REPDARRRHDRGVRRHPSLDHRVGAVRPRRPGGAGGRGPPAGGVAGVADGSPAAGVVPGRPGARRVPGRGRRPAPLRLSWLRRRVRPTGRPPAAGAHRAGTRAGRKEYLMSAASDLLLVVSVLAYLAAMVAHAAQSALRERGAPTPAAARQPAMSGVPAAAAAPASPVVERGAPRPVSASGPPAGDRPPRVARLVERVALATFVLAAAAHAATTVTRGLAAQRVPWGNMYEFLLSATLIGAI